MPTLTAPTDAMPRAEGPVHDRHSLARLHAARTDPTYVLEGREALTPVFEALNQYEGDDSLNGQTRDARRRAATGKSYTIANHLFTADGERRS